MKVEAISKTELDDIMSKFYVEVRKNDGCLYKKTSFYSLRFALQRKMKEIRGERFDIIEDSEFSKGNNIFTAQCVVLKKKGLAQINHHPAISEEDIKLLYESSVLSCESPVAIQRKVFFELMLHYCRRGMENLRDLTVNDFIVKRLANGVECVVKTSDELTKNHRINDENQDEGVMKATGKENCPVHAYKLYVSKLNPKQSALFQRPKEFTPSFGPWYDNMVLGIKTLQVMMKRISKAAKLSKLYTNHSIRATSITILDQNGVEARHIMSVSGHRSESSLRSYTKTSYAKRGEMSSVLSDNTSNKKARRDDFGHGGESSTMFSNQIQQPSPFLLKLQQQQRLFTKMFHQNANFVPSFSFNCGFPNDSPVKNGTEYCPQNVYNNCTFVVNQK